MNRRLMIGLAAALVIGACTDQTPTENSNSPAFAKESGNIGIHVVLKSSAKAAHRTELAKYGTLLDEIPKLNAIRLRATRKNLQAIQALRFVKAATPDAERKAIPIDDVEVADFVNGMSTWDQDAVNVTNFGAGRTAAYDGNGVYVAILDTGLLPTWRQYFPQQRIAEEYGIEFAGGGGDKGTVVTEPDRWEDDVNSHGTHVTSTILGYERPLSDLIVNGTAPKATVIPVKVLNQAGFGWSSAIARGIVYVTELKTSGALGSSPVVINMSLGGSVLDALEKEAIDNAIEAGVIIVASAGNSGEGGMGFPGAYSPVISAAASGWTGQWTNCAGTTTGSTWWRTCDVPENIVPQTYIAEFSSREKAGQDLDVAAPGAWVVGPYQTNQSNRESLFFLSGTSMASPHVAGIVALMAQKKPDLTAAEAEQILEENAVPLAAGCRMINNRAPTNVCWGTDATGAGLATADAALNAIP